MFDQYEDSRDENGIREPYKELPETKRVKSIHTGATGTLIGQHKNYESLWVVSFDAPDDDSIPYISWVTMGDIEVIKEKKSNVLDFAQKSRKMARDILAEDF